MVIKKVILTVLTYDLVNVDNDGDYYGRQCR